MVHKYTQKEIFNVGTTFLRNLANQFDDKDYPAADLVVVTVDTGKQRMTMSFDMALLKQVKKGVSYSDPQSEKEEELRTTIAQLNQVIEFQRKENTRYSKAIRDAIAEIGDTNDPAPRPADDDGLKDKLWRVDDHLRWALGFPRAAPIGGSTV